MNEPITHELRPSLRLVAAAGVFACMALQAPAATPEGQFAARGIGAQTCDRLAATEGDERGAAIATLSSWVAGYVTHANRVTPGLFDVSPIVDNTVLAAMVTQFCAGNPAALVESVLVTMLDAMASGGQRAESDLIDLRNGEMTVTLRSGTLVQVQRVLADKGHLPADGVDGAYGPRTRDALVVFQQQAALSQTGLPDPVTLLRLFSVPPT